VVGAARRIWLAEACAEHGLVRLESGRSRAELLAHLLEEIERDPRVAIGLDFAFSLPVWFLRALGVSSVVELWRLVDERGEDWLRACEPPWWGRPRRPRPPDVEQFRHTERALRASGLYPKSVFQVGGAGAVGTGSLRGMPLLLRLHEAGASIWPFDPPAWPVVVEIYPRLLTGRVVKSSPVAREQHVARWFPQAAGWHMPSEDAFDAALSALAMARCHDELACLSIQPDPVVRLEGKIWQPEALDWPRGSRVPSDD
jgi:hypothetical protein